MLTGFTSAFDWVAIVPAPVAGDTGPKPMPYRVMMSPVFAGRELTPPIAPVGATYTTPSAADGGNVATTYCLPLTRNAAGARRAGAMSEVSMAYASLWPCEFVTTSGTPDPAG